MSSIGGSGSLFVENTTPVPKLRLGGMEKPRLPPHDQLLRLVRSSRNSMSQRGAEMVMINKDNPIRELMKRDPKRVKTQKVH